MAAAIVQAQYDELEAVARRFDQSMRQIEDLDRQVRSGFAPLARGSWRGDAAAAFVAEMDATVFPAVGRLSPDYYCMDGTIPRKRLGEVLRFIAEMERKYGLRCPNVFHAGDGNLHPLILFDANDPDQLHRTELFAAEVLEKCVAVGGTITGEHGVGVEKINQMCTQFPPEELALFHAVKRVFDPQGTLNPGKAVPTLARCAEYGRMRVHGGNLPHPELPRF